MLQDKLRELYELDEDRYKDFKTYIYFRILEYDSEQDIFDSFDKYIDYCISMLKDMI